MAELMDGKPVVSSFLRDNGAVVVYSKDGYLEILSFKKENAKLLKKELQERGFAHHHFIENEQFYTKSDELKKDEIREFLLTSELEGILEFHFDKTRYHVHFWTNKDDKNISEKIEQFLLSLE